MFRALSCFRKNSTVLLPAGFYPRLKVTSVGICNVVGEENLQILGWGHLFRDNLVYLVVRLCERCLIACANYPAYWIRYALFMKVSGSMDLAENALSHATQVFLKRQLEIHLFATRFREQNGDIEAAYQLVHTEIIPGLMEALIKHSNMERRQMTF